MKQLKQYGKETGYIFLLFILTFVLCSFFVWTHDDYTSFKYNFWEIFKDAVYFGNGRYIGNFLVNFALVRPLLDRIIRTSLIVGYIVTVPVLLDAYHLKTLAVSTLMTFGAGNLLFSQVFCWGHGFYNYFPPVVLMLLSVVILKKSIRAGKNNAVLYIIIFVFGVAQQLFSENTTIINCLVAIGITGYCIVQKKTKALSAVYVVASILGAAIMFFLPKIMKVAYKMDEYRQLGGGGLLGTLKLVMVNLMRSVHYLLNYTVCWTLLSIVLIFLLKKNVFSHKLLRMIKPFLYVFFGLFPIISFAASFIENMIALALIGVLFALYILFAAGVLFFAKANKANKMLSAVLLILTLISVGEMLVVTVIGARCFFITYTCILLVVIEHIHQNLPISKKAEYTVVIAAVLAVCTLIGVYHSIWMVDNVRSAYAEEQMKEGKTTIEIVELPYEYWLNFPNESYAYAYYYNFGDPDAMHFEYISYQEYLNR